MKIVTHLLAAIIAATLVLVPVARKLPGLKRDNAKLELIHTKQIVEKRIADVGGEVSRRLGALGTQIAEDRDFSMKVIVEKDLTAPEVTDIGPRYAAPMGLNVLEITDGQGTILSSGHFAASAGGSVADKLMGLGSEPLFTVDNIKGSEILTMQSKVEFSCVGQSFFCIGGRIVDDAFLDLLTPRKGVQILLKHGTDVIGMEGIETMSGLEDNTIVINDVSYLAASIELPAISSVEALELIILMEEPGKASLLDLF